MKPVRAGSGVDIGGAQHCSYGQWDGHSGLIHAMTPLTLTGYCWTARSPVCPSPPQPLNACVAVWADPPPQTHPRVQFWEEGQTSLYHRLPHPPPPPPPRRQLQTRSSHHGVMPKPPPPPHTHCGPELTFASTSWQCKGRGAGHRLHYTVTDQPSWDPPISIPCRLPWRRC